MNPTLPSGKKRLINVGNAAALLIATSLIGQALGFLRTKLVISNFPVHGPNSTDAYFAAFSIPDFFFFTLAAGALGVALMPALSDHLHKNDRKGVWELSTWLMNFLAILMTIVGIIMLIFAPQLIKLITPELGSRPTELHNAATIMRLIAFNPLLFTISGILTSAQQTMGRFFFYAIAPIFYNTSMIISILIFSVAPPHNGGPGHLGLIGLGIGAAVGAVLQLLIIFLGNFRLNFHYHLGINWRNREFLTVLRNLPARSLDQGIDQLNSIVEIRLANTLGTGNVTYYSSAYTLSTAPILLIGTAVATAAFPRLNQRLSQGRPDLFRQDFLRIIRAMIWISAPVTVICYFARGYLARLIFSRGNVEIAIIFGFLTVAIFFRIMYSIISRWFYAQKDTRTPLLVSIFTIALNIVLAYRLSRPSSYGVSGLALAQSIVAFAEVTVLVIIMLFRDHKLFNGEFWGGVTRIMSVTGFSVMTCFIMISLYPLGARDIGIVTLGGKLMFITLVTMGVHVGVSALFGLEEVRPIFARLRKLILSPIKF
jgi:putative peptidoglycan lipid II flippase